MTKEITEFDDKTVSKLISEIDDKMRTTLEQYGLATATQATVPLGNSFTEFHIQFRVTVTNKREKSRAQEVYELHAAANGLDCEFGTELMIGGEQQRIIGWNPKAPKYPIITENVKSKAQYKSTIKLVKDALGSNGED